MKRYVKYLVIAGVFLFMVHNANAAVIIDTGPGPNAQEGWSLDANQWLAAEFTLTDDYVITDIDAWLYPNSGSLTYAIYGDGTGEVPDTTDERYSTPFVISGSAMTPGWYGPSSLAWNLPAGTYWLALEVRTGSSYSGSVPHPATTPLSNEAYTNNGSWHEYDALDIGVRIYGNPQSASVPEPSTMLLLGLGLMGLAGVRRKFNK